MHGAARDAQEAADHTRNTRSAATGNKSPARTDALVPSPIPCAQSRCLLAFPAAYAYPLPCGAFYEPSLWITHLFRAGSNENFLRLQDELAGTENRIAIERRRYNETLQDYNTYISLFPNNIIASLSGFTRNDAYFKTEEGARQAPRVNFGGTPTQQPAPAPTQ